MKFEQGVICPCACAGFMHLEVQNLFSFVHVQVLYTLKLKPYAWVVPVEVWCELSAEACLFDNLICALKICSYLSLHVDVLDPLGCC